jgi:hypothetical protein
MSACHHRIATLGLHEQRAAFPDREGPRHRPTRCLCWPARSCSLAEACQPRRALDQRPDNPGPRRALAVTRATEPPSGVEAKRCLAGPSGAPPTDQAETIIAVTNSSEHEHTFAIMSVCAKKTLCELPTLGSCRSATGGSSVLTRSSHWSRSRMGEGADGEPTSTSQGSTRRSSLHDREARSSPT